MEKHQLQSYLGPLGHLRGAVVHLVTVDYYQLIRIFCLLSRNRPILDFTA
jgi:hypothetical protein